MFPKFKKLSLEKQLFISFLSISIVLLVFSMGITLYFNMDRQKNTIDAHISSVASYIASMERVVNMLESGYPDPEAEEELDSLHENFSDLNVIAVYDKDGLRFYHTNRRESGESLVGGEEEAILAGSPPYITTGFGTQGTQRRAFHAVTGHDGSIIGFVMTSVFTTYVADQMAAVVPPYFITMIFMLAGSVLLSHGIVHLLRSSLMGHHPQELLKLYLQQDTVLNAMEEGIIASDRNGLVIFANQAAGNLFPEGTKITGVPISCLFPASLAASVIKTGSPVTNRSCQLSDHPLIYSELPIGTAPGIQGVLTIFNDRSEIESLSDELSGARSMLDTLRAFNHEFLNKLHVILGYLQTGQTDQAITFIINSNLVSSQAIRQTADCLRVNQICALVVGKMMHAAELGILLTVTPNSRCMNKDMILPMESYITIIGNLLENAIEELASASREIREITLGIYLSEDCTIITCEDTGRGIPKELIPDIFELGVSSKGENRGTGLYLIHKITELYHGEIVIETEENEGTCLTVTFAEKKEND